MQVEVVFFSREGFLELRMGLCTLEVSGYSQPKQAMVHFSHFMMLKC